MRAPFQEGEFPGPVKYGYASVGQVECGPADLKGRLVFALYPHQTRYVVPATAVHVAAGGCAARAGRARRQSGDGDQRRVGRAAARRRPSRGDRRRHGRLSRRLAGAAHAGLRRAARGRQPASRRMWRGRSVFRSRARPTPRARPTWSFTRAARPKGCSSRWMLPAFEATVVEMSWFGDRQVSLPLGDAFHSRRLTIKSSQVGRLPPLSARDGIRGGGWHWR